MKYTQYIVGIIILIIIIYFIIKIEKKNNQLQNINKNINIKSQNKIKKEKKQKRLEEDIENNEDLLKDQKNCWIDVKRKELNNINNNIQIIIDELNGVLKLNKWSRWSEYNREDTPIFTKMSDNDIIDRLKENEDYLNSGDNSWRLFGLKLYGKEVEENAKYCPKTIELFKDIDYVINIGFSCLEPGVSTTVHRDFNHNILRCHFPLIIPEGDCAIRVGDKIQKWNMNEYFIFDDTCYHVAWNKTKENRFILIVDFDKQKFFKSL
jgi:beta-hydroxylase